MSYLPSGAQSVPYLSFPVDYAPSWLESARHSPKAPQELLSLFLFNDIQLTGTLTPGANLI
jgi:hypothetical protein